MSTTVEDLIHIALEVTGMTRSRWDELSEVMKNDATMNLVMKEEWNAKPRDTEEAVREYYRESAIWFLNTFNHGVGALIGLANGARPELTLWQRTFADFLGDSSKKILDYGGGLLNDSWPLIAAGYRIALAEVGGPVTQFLLRYRALAGLEGRFDVLEVYSDRPLLETYAGAISFETLEHLLDPLGMVSHIHAHISTGGPFAFSVSFGDTPHAPYHIAKNGYLGDEKIFSRELKKIGLFPHWKADDNHFQIWRKA